MLKKSDWEIAISIQNAANLSGVVFEFARIMQRICDEANACSQGSDWKNTHPIVQLFCDKLVDMACVRTSQAYSKAYDKIENRLENWDGERVVVQGSNDGYVWTEVQRCTRIQSTLKTGYGYPHIRVVPERDVYEKDEVSLS